MLETPTLFNDNSPENPVFNVQLIMNELGACYSNNWNDFEETIIRLLDDALTQCHQIKQPQILLLPRLIFSPDLSLSAIGLLDERICNVRNRLITAYQKAIIPLKDYANEYDKYTELYMLDIEDYIR